MIEKITTTIIALLLIIGLGHNRFSVREKSQLMLSKIKDSIKFYSLKNIKDPEILQRISLLGKDKLLKWRVLDERDWVDLSATYMIRRNNKGKYLLYQLETDVLLQIENSFEEAKKFAEKYEERKKL